MPSRRHASRCRISKTSLIGGPQCQWSFIAPSPCPALGARPFEVSDAVVQFSLAGAQLQPLIDQTRGGDLQRTAHNAVLPVINIRRVEIGRGVEDCRKFMVRE